MGSFRAAAARRRIPGPTLAPDPILLVVITPPQAGAPDGSNVQSITWEAAMRFHALRRYFRNVTPGLKRHDFSPLEMSPPTGEQSFTKRHSEPNRGEGGGVKS